VRSSLASSYQKTPIDVIHAKSVEEGDVQLSIKREDLNHPFVSGNKWWKLKYNLVEARSKGAKTLLTFGGAFSNHLYATAAAARVVGLASIGIVRGERVAPLNPTLEFAASCGMRLHHVTRDEYKQIGESDFIEALRRKFGDFYLLPEGGTNQLAIEGCEEFARTLIGEADFQYLCVPVGTGGTMAGMINGLSEKRIIGFAALKGGKFLVEEVKKYKTTNSDNWEIRDEFHFGGYGKATDELLTFIGDFENEFNIQLDPVYTGKMMYGVMQLIASGYFERGSKILVLHTGGLQGRKGFNF
jgi:1-aminocyclopropane-1-carboxylate deaminase